MAIFMNRFLWLNLWDLFTLITPLMFVDLIKPYMAWSKLPKLGFYKLINSLLELGFNPSISESFLFIYYHVSITLYILVYVNNIILIGSDTTAINHVLSTLSQNFSLKDLGPLRFFLGLEIQLLANGLYLSQMKYICDFLAKARMAEVKPMNSPMAASTRLSIPDDPPFDDPTHYHSIVGSL